MTNRRSTFEDSSHERVELSMDFRFKRTMLRNEVSYFGLTD
jgi:hypothetical protein